MSRKTPRTTGTSFRRNLLTLKPPFHNMITSIKIGTYCVVGLISVAIPRSAEVSTSIRKLLFLRYRKKQYMKQRKTNVNSVSVNTKPVRYAVYGSRAVNNPTAMLKRGPKNSLAIIQAITALALPKSA